MPDASTFVETAPYTDDEIKILYEIIAYAQQSQDENSHEANQPLKSLLDAHDHVLTRYGKYLRQESTYFDFLWTHRNELGRRSARRLVDRFARLLWEQYGVQIQEIDGQEAEAEIGDSDSDSNIDQQTTSRAPRRTRRASFNDSHLEETWTAHQFARNDDNRGGRGHRTGQIRSSSHRPSHRVAHIASRSDAERQDQLRSRKYPQRIDTPAQHFEYEAQHPRQRPQTGLFHQPSNEELWVLANMFRTSSVKHRAISTWYRHCAAIRASRAYMNVVATRHDRQILLRQSLGQLRDKLSERRFWHYQERNAERVRSTFLLSKAFTHWSHSTAEQLERFSYARRILLQRLCLRTWQNRLHRLETIGQSFSVERCLSKWRDRVVRLHSLDHAAAEHRNRFLCKRIYWKWFWAYCAKTAPAYKDARLEKQHLHKLLQVYRLRLWQREAASIHWDRYCEKQQWTRLSLRLSQYNTNVEKAHSHCGAVVLAKAFSKWRMETRFRPLLARVQSLHNTRLAARVVTIWRWTTCTSRQAASIEQQRLLRNAWTQWNDSLRVKALTTKTGSRVVSRALLQWVLCARLALFKRVLEQRLLMRTSRTLLSRYAMQNMRLQAAYHTACQNRTRRLVQNAMHCLHGRLRSVEQAQLSAIEFRTRLAMQRTWTAMQARRAHMSQLSRWALSAQFYCLSKKTLQRWRDATSAQMRVKRHQAFETIRERHKKDVAARCMHVWHAQALHIRVLSFQASSKLQERIVHVSLVALRHWKEVSQTQKRSLELATSTADRRRLQSTLQSMSQLASYLHGQRLLAEAHATEVNEQIAARLLKKLAAKIFDVRYHHEKALAWRTRVVVRHRRAMLTHWRDKTSRRRANTAAADPESPSARNMRPGMAKPSQSITSDIAVDSAVGYMSLSQSISGLQAPDDSGSAQNAITALSRPRASTTVAAVATPLPGYLRTPSKRTARSLARQIALPAIPPAKVAALRNAQFGSSVTSSTTPAPSSSTNVLEMDALTPQITPFQRKLRQGGYHSGTPALGRSILGQTPLQYSVENES